MSQTEVQLIKDAAVVTADIADQAVTLDKLPHGTSSNNGKFLRANNGADPSFETVTTTTINSNADNRIITGSGTADTLNAESEFTFDGSNILCRAGEGGNASLNLIADQGDDNGDGWKIQSEQDENDLTFKSNISGSYVDKLKLKSSGQLEVQGALITTGDATISGSDLTVTGTNPIIHLTDTNDNSDFQLNVNAGVFQVYDHTNSAGRLLINSSGQTTIQPILKISNTPSGTSSGAIRINTDLALYGHIQVRDQNQNQTAALNVENANDGTGETNYIYRSVDLASSTWANARMTALSHNFQVQNDTPGASDRLKIDTNGLRVTGASSGATQVSGVRVNTDFLNYGGVTVRDAHTEGASDGSNHIACFQAENPGSGNNEVNLVSRSVNLNSANWARARYAALEHEFSIGGSSASGDVKATVTSSGIKLASSCGINFSAYASSGNPSSNLLDDYEEGTFTLTVASGGFSSINGTGFYSKVGRIVVFQGDFSFIGTGNSDVLKLDGLPFAAASWTACSGYAQYYNNEGSQQASWAVRGNTNDISVVEYGNEAAGNVFQAGYFNVAGCYNV